MSGATVVPHPWIAQALKPGHVSRVSRCWNAAVPPEVSAAFLAALEKWARFTDFSPDSGTTRILVEPGGDVRLTFFVISTGDIQHFRYPGNQATKQDAQTALRDCKAVRTEARVALGLPCLNREYSPRFFAQKRTNPLPHRTMSEIHRLSLRVLRSTYSI